MEFHIGQVFQGVYPPEAADWCNSTQRAYIVERDAVDGERQFEIVAVPEPTTEELAARVRAERDRRITATDYLVMPDYPLDTDKLEEIKAYRQALRDLPQQPGFPWGGPDDPACPWPEKFVTQIDWPELTVNANIKAKLSF